MLVISWVPLIRASPSLASRLIGVRLWLSRTYLKIIKWSTIQRSFAYSTNGTIILGVPPTSSGAPHLSLPHETKSKVGEGGEVTTCAHLAVLGWLTCNERIIGSHHVYINGISNSVSQSLTGLVQT